MKLIRTTNGQDVKVDDADFEELSKQQWTAVWDDTTRSYYARSTTGNRNVLMHRAILRISSPSVLGDHINHDTLDNQRDNLRSCTPSQNQWNRRANKGTRSGLKGAYWNKGGWVARIKIEYKSVFLGRFLSAEEAHQAYCCAARDRSDRFVCTS